MIKLIKKLINSTIYSISGLITATKEERSFQLEIVGFIILLPIIFMISKTKTDFCILLFSYVLIFITELINSALEALTDKISIEKSPVSKKIKDFGSAAVFLSIVFFVICLVIEVFNILAVDK